MSKVTGDLGKGLRSKWEDRDGATGREITGGQVRFLEGRRYYDMTVYREKRKREMSLWGGG